MLQVDGHPYSAATLCPGTEAALFRYLAELHVVRAFPENRKLRYDLSTLRQTGQDDMRQLFRRALTCVALTAIVALPMASSIQAQTQQQLDWCLGKDGAAPEQQIGGCTAAIQSGRYAGKPLASAFYHRGFAYNAKKDYDSAIADYDRAITLDPNFANAFFARAVTKANVAYRDKASYDLALQDYEKTLRIDSKYTAAYLNRGSIYLHSGRYDSAIQDYSEAIQLDPKNSKVLLARGIAYYNKNDYVRAISDFSTALGIDPKDAISLYGRGLAKKKSADVSGDADIVAARRIRSDIAETFKSYGGK